MWGLLNVIFRRHIGPTAHSSDSFGKEILLNAQTSQCGFLLRKNENILYSYH